MPPDAAGAAGTAVAAGAAGAVVAAGAAGADVAAGAAGLAGAAVGVGELHAANKVALTAANVVRDWVLRFIFFCFCLLLKY